MFKNSLPVFSALGDSNRQKLLLLMLEPGSKSVAELAACTHLSRPSVSHHLRILKDAKLVTERKVGTRHYYEPVMEIDVAGMQVMTNEIARIQQLKRGEQN